MQQRPCLWLLAAACLACLACADALDLINTTVVVKSAAGKDRLPTYAEFLVSSVVSRAWIANWAVGDACPSSQTCVVLSIGATAQTHAEAYSLAVAGTSVLIDGADERGVLYGVGRLLRLLNITFEESYHILPQGSVRIDSSTRIVSWPQYAIRGHQLGYRPKTNSYDGWSSAQFEQYILDLAVFGANQVELLPPNSDDFPSSPLRRASPMAMLASVAQAADKYGINVSLWYPAMYGNYSQPAVMAAAVAEWTAVFAAMPRLDAVFIPGGDPGGHTAAELMLIAAAQARVLRAMHPGAQMWLSPQGFDAAQMDAWGQQLRLPSTRAFLTGVVYGPWIRITLDQFAPTVPAYYPIRNYPDLAHSLSSELPVPHWDYPFAYTEGRETINPRPRYHAMLVAHQAPLTAGFSGYSEGCNDDVNKAVWSALHWGADQTPMADSVLNTTVRDYARFFGGAHLEANFAALLFGLEENWVGRAAADSSSIGATFAVLQRLEASLSMADLFNWRLMQARYRAYFDLLVRTRTLGLLAAEQAALAALAKARATSSLAAMDLAEAALRQGEEAVAAAVSPLILQLRVLGEGLHQSIRMKLSVPRYGAEFTERGANLDTINVSVTSAAFLLTEMTAIRALATESARVAAIEALLAYEDAGPDGFYDDLGALDAQPHLVLGAGPPTDPSYYTSALMDYAGVGQQGYPPTTPPPALPALRMSRLNFVRTHYGGSVVLRYGIAPGRYNVTVVYVTDDIAGGTAPVELLANNVTVHPYLHPQPPIAPRTFVIPAEATAGSALVLECRPQWRCPEEKNGCAIAEVWLRRMH